jgi:putative ABC transport system substrate-binding protein
MDRRTFIGAAAAGMIAAPLAASAQTAKTVRRIGVLDPRAPLPQTDLELEYAPLRALGWVVGQNLLVERRYANGKAELLRPLAEELVRLKVEIIVTGGTAATLAAKNATTTIPIIMYSAGDPVRSGLVASLSRPGGNITGFSIVIAGLATRRRAGEFDQSVLSRRAQRVRAGVPVTWLAADHYRSRRGRRAGECDRGNGSAASAGGICATRGSVLR